MRRPGLRRFLAAMGRAVSWHRRKLAVVAVVASVLFGVGAFLPPAPATVTVLRAEHGLRGGDVIQADDVSTAQVPAELVPQGALSEPSAVAGRVSAGDIADGQLVSSTDLLASRPLLPGGHVLAPVRLADEQVVDLLSEGMTVDVLAADEQSASARVIADDVRVAVVPPPPSDAVRQPDGRLILVEVTPAVASVLARSAVVSRLSVVWR